MSRSSFIYIYIYILRAHTQGRGLAEAGTVSDVVVFSVRNGFFFPVSVRNAKFSKRRNVLSLATFCRKCTDFFLLSIGVWPRRAATGGTLPISLRKYTDFFPFFGGGYRHGQGVLLPGGPCLV